jgi:hypothetical protein
MICFALVIVVVAVQIIGEKEYPKHSKHNKEFYHDYDPECFTYSHASETLAVKSI